MGGGLNLAALKREIYPLPDYVRQALLAVNLMGAYDRRPPYQRNDYIGWIIRAKHESTQLKRLNQMLAELQTGDKYMGMDYHAK